MVDPKLRGVRATAAAVATSLVAALLSLVPLAWASPAGAVLPGTPGVATPTIDPGTPAVGLATGDLHTCALTTTGTVDCWGDNSQGQATDQTATTYVAVAAGWLHSCAITTAGTVDCWGYNNQGQANDQTGTTYVAVSAGSQASCAITSTGTLQCWGYLTEAPPTGTFKALSVGGSHACAVSTAGGVECWGDNTDGKATDQPFGTPGAGIGYTAVGAGEYHTCALTTTGTVDCWGGGPDGQAVDRSALSYTALAVGANHNCAVATVGIIDCWGRNTSGQAVGQSPVAGILAIDGGAAHTCAALATGAVDCWGDNASGRAADQPGPGFMAAGLSVGQYHACVVVAGGQIDCWGRNVEGQANDQTSPSYVSVEVGGLHSCALTLVGTIDCWGDNTYGQATDPTGTTYRQVSAGGGYSCGLTATGAIDCWGYNPDGRADDQTSASYTWLDAGGGHGCAITAAGTIDCWGRNLEGQAVDQTGTTYTAVSGGDVHTCAITATGTIDCWGDNTYGQATDQFGRYRAVSAGTDHTCAITATGTIDCWGDNTFGQATDRTDTVYTAIATGSQSTCARAIDGRVRCWGEDIGPVDPFLIETLNPPAAIGFPPRSFGVGDVVNHPLLGNSLSLVAPTFSVVGGALPPGLSLSPTGQLTGTPTIAGDYLVDVAARTAYAESIHTRTISVGNRPVVIPPTTQYAPFGTPLTLSFYVGDEDSPPAEITNITGSPNPGPVSSNPTVLPHSGIALSGTGFERTITLTPTTTPGNVTVTFGVRDASGLSTHVSFEVSWMTAPMMSPIGDLTTPEATPVGPLAFVVSDQNDPASALTVSAASSNPTLVPIGNIALGGSGALRTVTVNPAVGQSGSADITLTVTDPGGLTATETFTLTVTPTSARIQGVVTEAGSGTPLGNVTVRLYSGTTAVADTTTAADGSYSFAVAPGAAHKLRFLPAPTHVREYWTDASTLARAATIVGAAGSVHQADAALLPTAGAAKVQGTITDATTGLPVANHLVWLSKDGVRVNSIRTSASGQYTFSGLDPAARWDLRVADGTVYGAQWYPAAPSRSLGTPLDLTGGSTTVADASVIPVGDLPTLTGTVVSAGDGTTPLAGVSVRVFAGDDRLRTVTTDAAGGFTVTGLLPGTYTVRVIDPSATHLYWWDEVSIAAGSPAVLNIAMLPKP